MKCIKFSHKLHLKDLNNDLKLVDYLNDKFTTGEIYINNGNNHILETLEVAEFIIVKKWFSKEIKKIGRMSCAHAEIYQSYKWLYR